MKSCTGRFHDHNSCLECTFLKRTIQFFGQINAFQQAEKREICENNVVVDVTVFVFTNISESNSTLLDVQQLPAFIGCCRRVDDLILVTALIGYQIKRILENLLAFLFCFFLPFLCGLKVGFRSFLGLTLIRKYGIKENIEKGVAPFFERIAKKTVWTAHTLVPACACVSGIFSGQRTRERSTEPAQLGGGQRRDDIRQLAVQRIGTIEERLTADDRNRRKPGRKNTLVRTGAVICIELIKDWCETAALHSAKYNKTVMTATPVFEISAVLDNDFTRSNTARAVLHGEIHCRQHTDEIGICLQAYQKTGMSSQPSKLRSCVSSAAIRIG